MNSTKSLVFCLAIPSLFCCTLRAWNKDSCFFATWPVSRRRMRACLMLPATTHPMTEGKKVKIQQALIGVVILFGVLCWTLYAVGAEVPPPNGFLVQSYQGQKRCLDYYPGKVGSPIFINDCSVAHDIIVEEIDTQHDVRLHAGTLVIGGPAPGPPANGPNAASPADSSTQELALTLQDPINPVFVTSVGQQFALDGDSIIAISNRDLVAKVHNARGTIGTPVVLGARNLADSEFWNFIATDGSGQDPTSGFIHVSTASALANVINGNESQSLPPAGYGTVVRVDNSINLSGQPTMFVRSGVTIRGDRRGTNIPPYLTRSFDGKSGLPDYFDIVGDDVRITGLGLGGPNTRHNTDPNQENSTGIFITGSGDNGQFVREYLRTIVDHNDINDFTYAGVRMDPSSATDGEGLSYCSDYPSIGSDPQTRPTNSHVWRNFIHYNVMQDLGYGVESEHGGYQLIAGNTFIDNRHAIAADGHAKSGYLAWYNLVLSAAPLQHGTLDYPFHTHDFDMHGIEHNGFGSTGGDYMDIFQNTFLGTNRPNFELRGVPCNYAWFHNNISLEKKSDAVNWTTCANVCIGGSPGPASDFRISPQPDQFHHPNPTSSLGVGDFDGTFDGLVPVDDLFLATGEAWYYSPGGKTEWRLLSPKTETLDQVLLGDFDGDGRTDVVAIHGGQFVVSWGGISDWEVLNPYVTLPPSLTETSSYAVGDFDGDGIADIFYADGHTWWVSYGGNTPWVEVQTSSFLVKNLRFGDFDGNGTTDVFGVEDGNWAVSYSQKSVQGLFSSWTPLQRRLTDSVNGLVVADFNGDGIADVAANWDVTGIFDNSSGWRISYGGVEPWIHEAEFFDLVGPAFAGVGHFLGHAEADVLSWNLENNVNGMCDPNVGQNTQLCISVGGITLAQRYSTQDMR